MLKKFAPKKEGSRLLNFSILFKFEGCEIHSDRQSYNRLFVVGKESRAYGHF